jgi:hypothetical protein
LKSENLSFIIPARGETTIATPKDFINQFTVDNLYIGGLEKLTLSLAL